MHVRYVLYGGIQQAVCNHSFSNGRFFPHVCARRVLPIVA